MPTSAADPLTSDPARGARAIENRRKLMLEQIIRSGSAQVDELASRFGVSRMTIHRDLDALAEQGMVRKQHGGVTLHESSSVESSFGYRSHLAERQKTAIARAAAALVHPGQTLLLDESTTTLMIAPHLSRLTPLTVITNGLAMIDRLKEAHGIKLIALGGTHNARLNAFFGLTCETVIATLRANTVFMSTSAVFGGVVFHQDDEVLKIKRALMSVADRRVLIVDSSKFGVTALNRLIGLDAFDDVITDDGLPEAERQRLRDQKVNLTVVPC
ncbi:MULTISPECIES: DeoR/GlpR family DNA-binding transcription regulator [Lichenihabitans]|uniref:DeoR/GlpR family DNA-binding transcription regulator n=1 Tax=Lichenihabitans TaxID=2723776 RepID=UPI001035877A|nr:MULTISPECIES: DeoR/GlpR family DNA-binding transcription regulator [Lichenihabitans]UDL94158.1 DeoR/GlpR family DNA-binding transcription regulator [Lichenihabitans sp. PAMC28606]